MEHHQSLMREENLYIQTLEMNMRHLSRKHKLIEWIVWALRWVESTPIGLRKRWQKFPATEKVKTSADSDPGLPANEDVG